MDLLQSMEEGKPGSILGRLDACVLCCDWQFQGPDQHLLHCRCMLWTCRRAWRRASRAALRCLPQIHQWHTIPPTQSLMGQICKGAEACRQSASQTEKHSQTALCFGMKGSSSLALLAENRGQRRDCQSTSRSAGVSSRQPVSFCNRREQPSAADSHYPADKAIMPRRMMPCELQYRECPAAIDACDDEGHKEVWSSFGPQREAMQYVSAGTFFAYIAL